MVLKRNPRGCATLYPVIQSPSFHISHKILPLLSRTCSSSKIFHQTISSPPTLRSLGEQSGGGVELSASWMVKTVCLLRRGLLRRISSSRIPSHSRPAPHYPGDAGTLPRYPLPD
ncbi:hypothetical protein JTE90_015759 [Oedothorax gibbosus]|uniref:Uncharacterized protein n=1 Tax=Oedothorax gibbosus TaxID=931172 RepID=A0AAV6VYE9_9ARAC|nr:hypothetical protein JTE90_015759 [Oedothorax gibbosus]